MNDNTESLGLITVAEYLRAREAYDGWCIVCEEFTRDSTEPDAERYDCPECGSPDSVYGAEYALAADYYAGNVPYTPPAPPAPGPNDRDDWTGLGDFFAVDKYGPAYRTSEYVDGVWTTFYHDTPKGGDSVSWSRLEQDTEGLWLMPSYCSYSDYGGSLIEKTNVDILLADYPDHTVKVYGSHGSRAVLVHWPTAPEELRESLCALQDYPLLDDSAHSAAETEAQNEAWENWARDDFRRELVSHLSALLEEGTDYGAAPDDYDADDVADALVSAISDADLDTLFREAAEFAGEYWENEPGTDMYINVAKVVAHGGAKEWTDREYYPISMEEICDRVYLPHCFLGRYAHGWEIIDKRRMGVPAPLEYLDFGGSAPVDTDTDNDRGDNEQ